MSAATTEGMSVSGMKAINQVSAGALAFLGDHRLAPSPANYRIAFHYLDGQHAELQRAIGAIADGGVRLTQAQADELYERFYGTAAGSSPADAVDDTETLRHQTLKLADLAASASAATGEFSRELSTRLPDIATADVDSLRDIFASSIERAERSERQLAAATNDLEDMRRQLEAVRGDAERDALTGLPNRRGIDARLAEMAAAGTVSVAVCDVDHFKQYNDRYGHAVGDRVLKTVAASLSESVTPHFVGRWGGEEFVIAAALPVADCARLIERAKDDLGHRHFKLRETDEPLGRVTFSAGVAALAVVDGGTEASIARADALLYDAKRAGRDRVLAA